MRLIQLPANSSRCLLSPLGPPSGCGEKPNWLRSIGLERPSARRTKAERSPSTEAVERAIISSDGRHRGRVLWGDSRRNKLSSRPSGALLEVALSGRMRGVGGPLADTSHWHSSNCANLPQAGERLASQSWRTPARRASGQHFRATASN